MTIREILRMLKNEIKRTSETPKKKVTDRKEVHNTLVRIQDHTLLDIIALNIEDLFAEHGRQKTEVWQMEIVFWGVSSGFTHKIKISEYDTKNICIGDAVTLFLDQNISLLGDNNFSPIAVDVVFHIQSHYRDELACDTFHDLYEIGFDIKEFHRQLCKKHNV